MPFILIVHRNENECKALMAHTHSLVDRTQNVNTKRLKERTHDVHKWKTTLERAIRAQIEEIQYLETQRVRLRSAMRVLEMPASIGVYRVASIVPRNLFAGL